MPLRKLFNRRAKAAEQPTKLVVRGVKEPEWYDIYEAIKAEHDKTALMHKKPTEYMRGLAFAIKAMEAIKPYNIFTEVQ